MLSVDKAITLIVSMEGFPVERRKIISVTFISPIVFIQSGSQTNYNSVKVHNKGSDDTRISVPFWFD